MKPNDRDGSIPIGDEQEGKDICSVCESVFDANTLFDPIETEFELICDDCLRKQLAMIPVLKETLENARAFIARFDDTTAMSIDKVLKQLKKVS